MTQEHDTTAIATRENGRLMRPPEIVASDFLPLLSIAQAIERKNIINQIIGQILVEGSDYGQIPGTSTKKVLYKAGAEKMSATFGLVPKYIKETVIEDWTGAEHGGEPLFHFEYRCQLYRGEMFLGEAIGSCNSWEKKYRYNWIKEENVPEHLDKKRLQVNTRSMTEFAFAVDQGKTDGQYGKSVEHWNKWREAIKSGEAKKIKKKTKNGKEMEAWEMGGTFYRVPNQDFADVINTCQKMGQKRAYVSAVLVVTNCSDAFTVDLEDQVDDHGGHGQQDHHDAPADVPHETESRPAAKQAQSPNDIAKLQAVTDYLETKPPIGQLLPDWRANKVGDGLSPQSKRVAWGMMRNYAQSLGFDWDKENEGWVKLEETPIG